MAKPVVFLAYFNRMFLIPIAIANYSLINISTQVTFVLISVVVTVVIHRRRRRRRRRRVKIST